VHQQQRRGRPESPGLIDERRGEPRDAQKKDEDPEADVKPVPGDQDVPIGWPMPSGRADLARAESSIARSPPYTRSSARYGGRKVTHLTTNCMVPIAGTTKRLRLEENVAAADIAPAPEPWGALPEALERLSNR
jgi:hypothetical protein